MYNKKILYTKLPKQELPEVSSSKRVSDINKSESINILPHSLSNRSKETTNSDSDVDSPRNSNSRNENESNTFYSSPSTKTVQILNSSTLNSIDPFPGYEPKKMRPLGEEFRARRTSKNLERKTDINTQQSLLIDSEDSLEDIENIPLKDNVGNKIQKLETITTPTENILNIHSTVSHTILRNFSIKSTNVDTDSDSDVDNMDSKQIHHPKSLDLIDHSKLFLLDSEANTDQIDYDNHNDVATLPSSGSITDILKSDSSANDITPERNCYPVFQDFLLDSTNFQVEEAMQAESVELEDFTTTEEDFTDDDESYVVASSIHDINKNEIINTGVKDYGQINSLQPKGVTRIEGECHILEDGHFFYEKLVDLEDESDEDLECQSVLIANNDIITTYKRPGSKVHFNLNKVRVYSTYLANEYNRRNDFINPLVASAEYEMEKRLEHMIIFPVDLFKGNTGLGISILGMGVDHSVGMKKLGIFVKSVVPGGAAERDGRIHIYDQIVEVNGQSLVSVSQQFAASVLRNTRGFVHFLIGREPDQSNSEIVKLVEKSRQLSGLPNPKEMKANSSQVQITEDNTMKGLVQEPNDNSKGKEIIYLQSLEKIDEYKMNQSYTNEHNINKHYKSTQTESIFEESKEECKFNKEKMLQTIFELRNEVSQYHIIKLKMENLTLDYAKIKSQLIKCQIDTEEKGKEIYDLRYRNKLLEERYHTLIDEHSDGDDYLDSLNHSNADNQQSQEITFYLNKIKYLEDRIKCLELKSTSPRVANNVDNLRLSKDGSCISLTPFSDDNMTEFLSPAFHLSDNDRINNVMISRNSSYNADESHELKNQNYLLDNEPAQDKTKLGKISQIANRKPPTKLMMIGDDPIICLDSQLNKSNSSINLDKAMLSDVNDADDEREQKYSKNIISKIIGGFALPGKSEIRLGIKPSTVHGSRRTANFHKDIIEDIGETDETEILDKYESAVFKTENVNSQSEISTVKDMADKSYLSEDYLINYNLQLNNTDSNYKNELFYISPLKWDKNHVIKWLKLVGLTHIEQILLNSGISTGSKLIRLDSDTIKKLGIANSNDRLLLKRNIKELRYLIENTLDINGNSNA